MHTMHSGIHEERGEGDIRHTRIPDMVFVNEMERSELDFGMQISNMERIPVHTMHSRIHEESVGDGIRHTRIPNLVLVTEMERFVLDFGGKI